MTDFGRTTLPYCSFRIPGAQGLRVGVGIDADILDLTSAAADVEPRHAALFGEGTLDRFLGAGAVT